MIEKKPLGVKTGKTSPDQPGKPGPSSSPSLSPFQIEEGKTAAGPEAAERLDGPGSIGSQASEISVNPRVAGQLLNLPFKCAHIIWPVAEPLTADELEAMSEPFSDFLVENGLEKIGRSSVVLGFHVFIAGYARVKAIADWKKSQRHEAKIKAAPGDGEARPGKDDVSPGGDPRGGGAGSPGLCP